jgi:flagellar basal-body rod protein FlgC
MGMFAALDSSASGAKVSRIWLDAISDNVANVNTVRPAGEEPFRSRLVVARSYARGDDRGAEVAGIVLEQGDAQMVYDPEHPYADAKGYVLRPKVDLSEEMTNMLIAQRSYQANLSVIDRVRDAYKAALSIRVN